MDDKPRYDIPGNVKHYVNDHGLQFDLVDLRSPVVQRMLRLRTQHPEWKRDQIQRRQERDWLHWQG